MFFGSAALIFADGGHIAGLGGTLFESAGTITGHGGGTDGTSGGGAFGAGFCPNGPLTGRGGDIYSGGQNGYVLLIW